MSTAKALFFAALLGASSCGGASTPELCDQACRLWGACTGEADYYPYAKCNSDCTAQGDWGQSYVDCLKGRTTCAEMQSTCG